jgi:hypothetical protein
LLNKSSGGEGEHMNLLDELSINGQSDFEEILLLINKCDLLLKSGLLSNESIHELRNINEKLIGLASTKYNSDIF